MEIICPECQFSREVDESKIPSRSQVATCPKCKTKFKFRDLADEEESSEQVAQESAETSEHEAAQPQEAAKPQEAPLHEPEESTESEEIITHPHDDPAEKKKGLWDALDEMAPPKDGVKTPKSEEETATSHESDPSDTNTGQSPIPGWTGEFNSDFPDPNEVDEESDPAFKNSPMVPPPFEQLDKYGFFRGLVLTVKLVLASPRLFFSVMPVGGGLSKPLTFTILLTMIQGFVQYFWGMVGLSASVGAENAEPMSGVSGALAPVLMLLFMPAFIAAGQFVVTGVYHMLLVLMRADHKGFEGTFRALAYANAPIILGIFPMPVMEIEMAWMAIVAVWGLALTIMGLKHIHQAPYAKIIPVALVPLLLAIIGGILVFQSQISTI